MAAADVTRGWALAVALLVGCRADHRPSDGAGSPSLASSAPRAGSGSAAPRVAESLVPRLPASPDGVDELHVLDRRIEIHRDEPELEIVLLLERAWIRGRLEDYRDALQRSAAWIAKAPNQPRAWQTRAQVLTRVHELAAARAALAKLRSLVRDPGEVEGLAATIDEATGAPAAAGYREKMARDYPDPTTLTRWAVSLAAAGRPDDALAVMQRVPSMIHDNPPELLAWILFQWGRIYEGKGEPAAARQFYEAAHARLPTLEATLHLAQTIAATGGDPGALVTAALADNRHPALLALAGNTDEAKRGWERYVSALPRAFAGHAARFYLGLGRDPGPGRDPARALELARLEHATRDTAEARTLVVEAALAAGDAASACELASPLSQGARAQQFVAWRAFTACKRTDEATALAEHLGIHGGPVP
jgi:tetratricopeptide (TPR) repeat protein